MSAEYLQWFDVTFSDGRNVRIAAHEPVEIENGLNDGCLDNLLEVQEGSARLTIRQIHCRTQESQLFTVFGVYEDNGYQRFGFMAGAQSPEDAEAMVQDYATYFCWGDPVIACVLEGEHRAVDADPAFGMREKWQAASSEEKGESNMAKEVGEGHIEGWACPKCGQHESFRIQAKTMFEINADGTDHCGDVEWDDDNYADCPECAWHGTIKDVLVPEEEWAEQEAVES